MRILAIDIGSTSRKATKSYASCLDTSTGEIERSSCPTLPGPLLALLGTFRPDRVVIEQTVGTGWIVDLCRGAGVAEVQALNPRDPAWLNRTAKTDRLDADLLAHLSASGQAKTVHVPDDRVRQWRVLVDYRHRLVHRRTRVKNRIKALLRNRGLPTSHLWTAESLQRLTALAQPIATCSVDHLWHGELHTELAQLTEIDIHINAVTTRLDHLVDICPSAKLLTQLDGIGPRTAEAVVSVIDNPLRFTNRKKLGAYLGLVSKVHQSGSNCRYGGITKAGNPLLRALLTQVVQSAILTKKGWIYDVYMHLRHPHERSGHRAIMATARRVAVILWAKLRDHRRSNPHLPLFDIREAA